MRFAVAAVIPKYTSSQKPRFSGIFIIKSRYPGGLEKMYLGGKTQPLAVDSAASHHDLTQQRKLREITITQSAKTRKVKVHTLRSPPK